jgi:hypothetical protein
MWLFIFDWQGAIKNGLEGLAACQIGLRIRLLAHEPKVYCLSERCILCGIIS